MWKKYVSMLLMVLTVGIMRDALAGPVTFPADSLLYVGTHIGDTALIRLPSAWDASGNSPCWTDGGTALELSIDLATPNGRAEYATVLLARTIKAKIGLSYSPETCSVSNLGIAQ